MSFIKEFEHLKIPLDDIKCCTNNFGSSNCIGRGGFGKVYRGEIILFERQTVVAVKHLDTSFGQGAPEFWKEIMLLSRYKHKNLVSLLGFCDESGESILVYEYLSNRSLDLYLSSTTLSWNQRLRIYIGAARGLQYLHDPDGTQQRVLHRDIKSSNILLDENWNAKISDFGLSKIGPANQQFSFLFSNAVGTMGYCDPLYHEIGYLTKESDIYSFGVVLFEVLCGRPCVQNYEDIRRFLGKLAQRCYEEKNLDTIIKSDLKDQISPRCLERFSSIAYQCLRKDRVDRPSIAKVIKDLETALEYQEQPEHQTGYIDMTRTAITENIQSCYGSNYKETHHQQTVVEEVKGGKRSIPNQGNDFDEYSSTTSNNNVSNSNRLCRSCGIEESCVLLLPCRHLCLCTKCDSILHICPICTSVKNASVNVNLS